MNRAERERFDALLEAVIEELPAKVRALLDEVPVIVEDSPSAELLEELGMLPEEADELCGLHTGLGATERSVEDGAAMSSNIMLFREGIVAEAGGWGSGNRGEQGDDAVRREIRITLLHEIGHEFGLDEDDLDRLGYG
ncbi:MAG: metallopeptidase family protein [Phycisphaerales bacterium]